MRTRLYGGSARTAWCGVLRLRILNLAPKEGLLWRVLQSSTRTYWLFGLRFLRASTLALILDGHFGLWFRSGGNLGSGSNACFELLHLLRSSTRLGNFSKPIGLVCWSSMPDRYYPCFRQYYIILPVTVVTVIMLLLLHMMTLSLRHYYILKHLSLHYFYLLLL